MTKPERPPLYAFGPQNFPGQYFQGEQMTCVICGKQQQSSPDVESQWRVVELDRVAFYACPDEFPPDNATQEEFASAYRRVLLAALAQKAGPK